MGGLPYYYKKRKAILELNVPKTTLNEQEKIDFKLAIPQDLEYSDIYKISIIDGVDKEWPVDWPSVSTVKKKTNQTVCHINILSNRLKILFRS